MTATLKEAFEKAASLPEPKQEAFAQYLLDKLEFLTAMQEGVDAAESW